MTIGIWLVVFMLPVIYFAYMDFYGIREEENASVTDYWIVILPFFLIFLLHHFLFLPRYFLQKKRLKYLSVIVVSLAAMFAFDVVGHQPEQKDDPSRHEMEMPLRQAKYKLGPHPGDGPRPGTVPPPANLPDVAETPPPDVPQDIPSSPLLSRPEVQHLLLAVLILCLDISIAIMRENKRMREEEKMQLQHELRYLRYQINPHFLMNTLHNIRALMELDVEQAKQTIVDLSQFLRIVLYKGEQKLIHLKDKLEFLRLYVNLMQIRYQDRKVDIQLSLPEAPENAFVPPLILSTFLENAFKHGIDYRSHSFIHAKVTIEDGRLVFFCENSKHPEPPDKEHGIGLKNIRKTLGLIFGSDYTLDIDDKDEKIYRVRVSYPITYKGLDG